MRCRPQVLLQHGHKGLDLYTTSRRSCSFSPYSAPGPTCLFSAADCLPYQLSSRSARAGSCRTIQPESRCSICSICCRIQPIPIKCSVQSIPTIRTGSIQLCRSLSRATTPTPASRSPQAQRSHSELQTMGRCIHQAWPTLRPQPRHQREFLEVPRRCYEGSCRFRSLEVG
jgi:hypothetical protein